MRSFKVKFLAVMLIVALALTGCMKEEVVYTIRSDGSASGVATMDVDKEAFEAAAKKQGATDAEIKEYWTTMEESGAKLVTIDGKEYYEMVEKQNIKAGNLVKEFIDMDNQAYATADTIYFRMKVEDEFSDYQAMGIDLSGDVITCTMSFVFPNPVVSTTGTIDKENPNKVTFNIAFDQNTTVFATTKSGVTVSTVKATVKKLNTVKATKITKLKANKVKATAKKATATLKFRKVANAKKYQVQYSKKANFKGKVSKMTKKNTYTIKNLKKGTKYYVRVRVVKKNYAGLDIYSKWVKKSVTTKK